MRSIHTNLTIAGALAVVIVASPALATPLPVRERSADVSEATIILDAPPRQVYELATSYTLWPSVFSDIRSVAVLGGTRDRARVRFRSQAIDREVTVDFDNVPGRVIRFTAIPGSRAGRAGGEYILTPLDGGRRTQLTARLFLKVVGPAKLFVSTQEMRAMRQRKLRADLGDTQRWIAQHQRPASPVSAR